MQKTVLRVNGFFLQEEEAVCKQGATPQPGGKVICCRAKRNNKRCRNNKSKRLGKLILNLRRRKKTFLKNHVPNPSAKNIVGYEFTANKKS